MKRTRNITQKNAPLLPAAPTEPKRVKLSPATAKNAAEAVRHFNAAREQYNAAAQLAKQQHDALMQVAQMHDGLFRALIEDGGFTIEDFQHGFDLRDDDYLYPRPPKE